MSQQRAPREHMICSSDRPDARGSFDCSDAPVHDALEHELTQRAMGRRRRADRETLRDIGPPSGLMMP